MKTFLREQFTVMRAKMVALMGRTTASIPAPVDQRSDREQLIAEMLEIEQRDRQEAAAYELRLASLSAELEIIQRQANALHRQIDLEHAGRMQRNFERDTRIDKIKRELADGCPAQVDEFLDRVKEDIETLQGSHRIEPRAAQRLAVLRDCRQRAAALRTAPIPMEDLMRELRQLEQSVKDESQESSLAAAR